MRDVAIINYGSGNLRSAAKAFERAAAVSEMAVNVSVTDRADHVATADYVVLPGVGAFSDCFDGLSALDGMLEAVRHVLQGRAQPFLGICVGMQLLATRGLEHGTHAGLDAVGGTVAPLDTRQGEIKVPHMGWNELEIVQQHPIFQGIDNAAHVYFVHSFALRPERDEDVIARVDYGQPVVAAVAHENIIGTQFHPEKSQQIGLQLISNFLHWRP